MCEQLQSLKRDAARVIRTVKNIRRSRDLSFYEDAELNGIKHKSINAILKHLLVGHQGQPCPAGDRPIVSPPKGITSSLVKRRIAPSTALDEPAACIDLNWAGP
jgi:hypothetical protein